jgi:hypothetical protein
MPGATGRIAVIACVLAGCSANATIIRGERDGGTVYGKIVGVGERNLYVRTPSGEEIGVPRDEIEDIDHPGNVLALVGAAIVVSGAYNIWVGLPNCDSRSTAFCVAVVIPAVVGAGMSAWGGSVYARSHAAAKSPVAAGRRASVFLLPSVQPGMNSTALGLALGGRF